MLKGFFVDWPNPPSPQTHLKLLENSSKVVMALDEQSNQIVGFITAISDGVLSAYIPFLEVLPPYKSKGIGKELINRMLIELQYIYMIDLCCDDDLVPLYEKFGMMKSNGMLIRNYSMQSGVSKE
ncbi:GNAT family N-acetyltransferase [Lysinibacillus fusiformis]|nr:MULTISPECIES: GNAT family N-acetyltransferase [Lysinibacillus]MED4672171.1 GNAT family N-acetyltransferase [Lysinibacillus fusiformis]QAS59188.1 GNAT family N-acetyltransferase [Lysinibacillus sphaericus]RDV34951.1 GNAT family N-acetyltransferase [Lysinibacillus fusiformis]HAU32867.1 GNAT family N-acetyltransferase [Lysinibacillus sp.]